MRLEDDPRWLRFNNADFKCPCCDRGFGGIFDIGFDHPDPWPHGNLRESGEDKMVVGNDMLDSDLCVVGGDFFVRCILPIPIIGSNESFAYGPWGSMSEQNFKHYLKASASGDVGDFQGCFSWLANFPPGWEIDTSLPCNLYVENANDRPRLEVQSDTAHPLAEAQRIGITFDRLLDLYAAGGNDIRPHLIAH